MWNRSRVRSGCCLGGRRVAEVPRHYWGAEQITGSGRLVCEHPRSVSVAPVGDGGVGVRGGGVASLPPCGREDADLERPRLARMVLASTGLPCLKPVPDTEHYGGFWGGGRGNWQFNPCERGLGRAPASRAGVRRERGAGGGARVPEAREMLFSPPFLSCVGFRC